MNPVNERMIRMAAKADKKKTTEAVSDRSERQKALEMAMAQIEKQYGKGSIMRLGENTKMNVDAVPTGSIALDFSELKLENSDFELGNANNWVLTGYSKVGSNQWAANNGTISLRGCRLYIYRICAYRNFIPLITIFQHIINSQLVLSNNVATFTHIELFCSTGQLRFFKAFKVVLDIWD